MKTTLKGKFKNVEYDYTPNTENEDSGILIINLSNGVQSTHIIPNWGYTRIFQYIESMNNLV